MAAVLTLTKARTELGSLALEQHIGKCLQIPSSRVSLVIDDDGDGCSSLIIYPEEDDIPLDADDIAIKLNTMILHDTLEWLSKDSLCEVADDEESLSIDEEDALQIWQDMSEFERTSHLDKVPNPDGIMIQPSNNNLCSTIDTNISPTESHLKRDPTLLQFDNVERIDISQIHTISWQEPIIITNAIQNGIASILSKEDLVTHYGDIEVRTGNRETLIENGITNSKPMLLSDALQSTSSESNVECGTIVFSPVKELPDELANSLQSLFTDHFPKCDNIESMEKFTLTLASEGFGIGIHKHKEAMFMLAEGVKKWYMASSDDLEADTDTHPGFYQEKSTHKCIQKSGEILYVPNEWFHEIFNISEYTAGIQALPTDNHVV